MEKKINNKKISMYDVGEDGECENKKIGNVLCSVRVYVDINENDLKLVSDEEVKEVYGKLSRVGRLNLISRRKIGGIKDLEMFDIDIDGIRDENDIEIKEDS